MNIRPLGDKILIKQISEEAEGVITVASKEKKDEGEVVALSEWTTKELEIGDRVIYKKGSGHEVTIDKQEYKVISEEDILAIIE